MKRIKLKFFHKLLIYSLSLVIGGVFVVQFLNLSFLDSFYIYRKKREIPLIAKEIKKLKNDPEALNNYIESEIYESGTQIKFGVVMPQIIRERVSTRLPGPMSRGTPYESPKEFNKVELKYTKSGTRYLSYRENIDGVALLITVPLLSLENYRFEVKIIELLSIIITLIFAFILARFYSKKLTRDMEVLNIAAKKMSKMEFVENLDIQSQDEIGELATSIEEMGQDLKQSIDSLKNFVSNASHELKTPISVINMTAQSLKQKENIPEEELHRAIEIFSKESKEMAALIENLMLLSKLSYSKNSIKKSEFNLRELLKSSLEKFESLELDKDLQVDLEVNKDLNLKTDMNFFKIAMDNLIQNAFKYSPYEGTVKIICSDKFIQIENNYENDILESPSSLMNPFKRGSNADFTQEGSGLGLSLVKDIFKLLEYSYQIDTSRKRFSFKIFFN